MVWEITSLDNIGSIIQHRPCPYANMDAAF